MSRTYDHACAVITDGTIRCWGDDSDGQLGNGLTDEECTHEPFAPECSLRPNVVEGITNATQVSVGIRQSCAVLADGVVECWGVVGSKSSTTPTALAGMPEGVVEVGTGGEASCVRTGLGEVWCWGIDLTAFPTPLGPPPPHDDPRRIEGIEHAAQLAVGSDHVCVRLDDGHMKCWGFDTSCQLLQPPESFPPDGVARTPAEAPGIVDAIEISASDEGTTVLHSDGSVTMSGCDALPSTVVPSMRPASHVSGAVGQACLLDRSGRVQCFGNPPLGDGTSNGHWDAFVDVVDLPPAKSISTFGGGGCAVTLDDEAWCWGQNGAGEVGDGTAKERDAPVRVVW